MVEPRGGLVAHLQSGHAGRLRHRSLRSDCVRLDRRPIEHLGTGRSDHRLAGDTGHHVGYGQRRAEERSQRREEARVKSRQCSAGSGRGTSLRRRMDRAFYAHTGGILPSGERPTLDQDPGNRIRGVVAFLGRFCRTDRRRRGANLARGPERVLDEPLLSQPLGAGISGWCHARGQRPPSASFHRL